MSSPLRTRHGIKRLDGVERCSHDGPSQRHGGKHRLGIVAWTRCWEASIRGSPRAGSGSLAQTQSAREPRCRNLPIITPRKPSPTSLDFLGWDGLLGEVSRMRGRSFMRGATGRAAPLLREHHDPGRCLRGHAISFLAFDLRGHNKAARKPRHAPDGTRQQDRAPEHRARGCRRPSSSGPLPLNLERGDATLEELIGEVKRGVYVTRFH